MDDTNEPRVVAYDPASDSWEPIEFTGDAPIVGTDQSLALAGDGRIYAHGYVIDISDDAWEVTPFDLVAESDVWAGSNLTAGGDGRIYRRADDTGSSRTELVAYDPTADAFERTSSTASNFALVYPGPDGELVMLAGGDGDLEIIRYDPDTDSWSGLRSVPGPGVDPWHAAIGPDDSIYVPGFYATYAELWAVSLGGAFQSVEPPDWATDWDVDLLWSPDGDLYVIGDNEVWRFTPEP